MKRVEKQQRKKDCTGFTLIELMVVIGIIGSLVSFVVPALDTARIAAYRQKTSHNLHQVGLALQQYCESKGKHRYYPGSKTGTTCDDDVDMFNALYAGRNPVLNDPELGEHPVAPTAEYQRVGNNYVFTKTDFFSRNNSLYKLKISAQMSEEPVIADALINYQTGLHVLFQNGQVLWFDIDDPAVAGTTLSTFSWQGQDGSQSPRTDLLAQR